MPEFDSYEQAYLASHPHIDIREELLKKAERRIRSAKILLFVVGGLNIFLGGLIYYQYHQWQDPVIIASAIIGFIFIALGILAQKWTVQATLAGLVLYSVCVIFQIINSPSTFYNGIALKFLIVFSLIRGFIAARDVKRLREEIGKLDEAAERELPMDMMQ